MSDIEIGLVAVGCFCFGFAFIALVVELGHYAMVLVG